MEQWKMTQINKYFRNSVLSYEAGISLNLSSKGEAPFQLMQHLSAIYSAMSASMSKKGTKVIPPDCFF